MTQNANPIKHQIYLSLPNDMYTQLTPKRVESPALLALNHDLLHQYGVESDWFEDVEGINFLSGNGDYSSSDPVAMAYAGHQFGYYSPLLGDGRAHMLGQIQTRDGNYVDVQLKGSGRTPYSRGGDGRATVGAVIREYLIGEAMAGLGIPTTRTIAILSTGENVMRDYQMVPGGIQVRAASSHIRVGSFQYAYAKSGESGVKALADHLIEHHYPELSDLDDKYPALLEAIGNRQAHLIAKWMLVGFIHGVMNTDNMSLVGETIDFGPCAFMDEFKAGKVFSSIDRESRYAWNQQANIGYWNLSRLAETLLPLFDSDDEQAIKIAETRLQPYVSTFQDAFQQGLKAKLGITSDSEIAEDLINHALPTLEREGIDFTLFFDALTRHAQGESDAQLLSLFSAPDVGQAWLSQWEQVRDRGEDVISAMRRANPALIARNHQVEKAIDDAMERNDFTLFHRLAEALKTPYDVSEDNRDLQAAPEPQERVLRTFCGT
ncbi:protein adenylyltransferase SelO [Enterovibrio coralii]|uniref:Protein nucleotidyltransferase YdiU n=1 Tax=Enterovibrio coralii TaxID=294935 RepID=A0A135I334_9GAMM|nr:YdiU family protein [Enterovibrio coralii]KXF79841.1 selenoprotein O and cysteine like protein [Enterovibrio coralii]